MSKNLIIEGVFEFASQTPPIEMKIEVQFIRNPTGNVLVNQLVITGVSSEGIEILKSLYEKAK